MTPAHPEIIQITQANDWFYAEGLTVLPVAVFALTRDGTVIGMVKSARGGQLEAAPTCPGGFLLERRQLTPEQEKTADSPSAAEEAI
jgi:hypothetical protein